MYKNPRYISLLIRTRVKSRYLSTVSSKPIIDLTDPNAKELTKEEFLALSNIPSDVSKLKPHEYRQLVVRPDESEGIRDDKRHVPHSELIKFKKQIVKDIDQDSQKLMYQDRGVYKMNRQEYYRQFFNKDGGSKGVLDEQGQKYYKLLKNPPKVRERRIRSSQYWYRPGYSTPNVEEISKLSANELKFTLMNQARLCRSNGKIDRETWNLLLERVLKISSGKVRLRTLIRYLQAVGNVQLDVNWRVIQLIDLIYKKRVEMKPKHYIYLFQALSRLRYQGLNLFDDLHEMMLCWSILRNNFLIKAANSLSKLGVGNELLAQPLQKTLSHRIATFTGSDCIKVKSIACLEMFTDDMIVAFLHKCDYNRTLFCHYTRHLEVIELYLRLMKPHVYERLSEATREFLKNSRENTSIKKKMNELIESEDLIDDNNLDIEKESNLKESGGNEEGFVASVRRLLRNLNISTEYGVIAGPFTFDLYNSERNVVVECCPPYQFYSQTGNYTASALWRHRLIRAMGFRLVLIPYTKWNSLPSDNDKGIFLNTLFSDIV